MIFFFFFHRTSSARGGGEGEGMGGALPDFFFFFPCSADHERDWPPCKVIFFGLATNALNVRNNNNNNNGRACNNTKNNGTITSQTTELSINIFGSSFLCAINHVVSVFSLEIVLSEKKKIDRLIYVP